MAQHEIESGGAMSGEAAGQGGIKGIDVERVSAWLVENIDGLEAPFTFDLITGGRSNLTYCVGDAAGRKVVLRRPPTGSVLATAHDMVREHRVISAIWGSDVPVPETLGLCQDTGVNDAPFYIMNFVEGTVLVDANSATKLLDAEARKALGEHVVTVLAALHGLDPDAIGLGDLGRREAYLARQLKRWNGQWEKTKTRELPAMDEVFKLLTANIPEQVGDGVVHGDFRLGNMLVDANGRIQAVLDWELCTLGDPLADIGYLLNNWADPDEEEQTGGAALSPTSAGGFLSRAELVARYEELSGRELHSVDYYRGFQYWRLAAIVEGVLARYLKGVMGDKVNTDVFRSQVDLMAEAALEMMREG
jgi:aminoglycoside phosphotransferase (APT) family kinase protein